MSYSQIGSINDVGMINQDDYTKFMNYLYSGMNSAFGGFQGANQNALSQFANVANTAQGYQDYLNRMYANAGAMGNQANAMFGGMGQNALAAGAGYASMQGAAGNMNNYAKEMQGMYQNLANQTQGFNPNAAVNQLMSMNPQMAQLANQNIANALSDVYTTGRSQAQAAAAQARGQAADQLAAAGLLNSGAGVQAMTKATAQPIMEMESQLANMRSQAYQNQLGQLQNQAGQLVGQGYGQAGQLGMQASQLGLSGQQLAAQLQEGAASGFGNLASLYGGQGAQAQQLGQGYEQLALSGLQGETGAYATAGAGYQNAANTLANLYGNALQTGGQMSQPYYYTPQYAKNPGLLDWITGIGGAAAGIGGLAMGIPGLGSAVSGLFQGAGGRNEQGYYAPSGYMYGSPYQTPGYQNPWAAGYRGQ